MNTFNYLIDNITTSFSYLHIIKEENRFENEDVFNLCTKCEEYDDKLYEYFKANKDLYGFISLIPCSPEYCSLDQFGDLIFDIRRWGDSSIDNLIINNKLIPKDKFNELKTIIKEYAINLDLLYELMTDKNIQIHY